MTDSPAPGTNRLADLAFQLVSWRNALTTIDEQRKEVQAQHDKVEADLFDALENAGVRSVKTEYGTFALNDLAWARIVDPASAKEWADQNHPELLTLNHTRLSVIVREALRGEPGAAVPPGVEYTLSRKINWRKS